MIARDRILPLLRHFIGVGIILITGVYVYQNRQAFTIILSIQAWEVAALISLSFLFSLINAALFSSLYRALGVPVGVMESFYLSTIGGLLAIVFPQAAYLTKVVYLKQRYNFPYSKTPAIFLGSIMVFFITGMFVVGLSLMLLTSKGEVTQEFIWLVIPLLIGIAFLWRLDIPERLLLRLGRVGNMLRLFLEGWRTLRQNRRCLVQVTIYQMLMFVVAGIAFSVAFASTGNHVSPLAGTVMAASTSFFNLVSITPGNLGIQEATVGYLSLLVGYTFVAGTVASMLLRIAGLIVVLLVAPFAYFQLFWRRAVTHDSEGS